MRPPRSAWSAAPCRTVTYHPAARSSQFAVRSSHSSVPTAPLALATWPTIEPPCGSRNAHALRHPPRDVDSAADCGHTRRRRDAAPGGRRVGGHHLRRAGPPHRRRRLVADRQRASAAGDRVVIYAPNTPWWSIADLAIMSAGADLRPDLRDEHRRARPSTSCATAGATVAFVGGADQYAHLAGVRHGAGPIRRVVSFDPGVSLDLADSCSMSVPLAHPVSPALAERDLGGRSSTTSPRSSTPRGRRASRRASS